MNENTLTIRQKTVLNEKVIQTRLCLHLKNKHIQFSLEGEQHATDAKEFRVNFP